MVVMHQMAGAPVVVGDQVCRLVEIVEDGMEIVRGAEKQNGALHVWPIGSGVDGAVVEIDVAEAARPASVRQPGEVVHDESAAADHRHDGLEPPVDGHHGRDVPAHRIAGESNLSAVR